MFPAHNHPPKVERGKPKLIQQTESQSQSQNENLEVGEIGLNGSSSEIEPKKRRGRVPGGVNVKAQGETLKRIETGFKGMLQGAGSLMLAMGGKVALDGQAILLNEPNLTASVVELCRQDKRAREFMLSLTTGSAYANVAIATVPIVIAILANHNLLPPIFGIAPQQTQSPNGTQVDVEAFMKP